MAFGEQRKSHIHEKIACDNCFAYVPEDICGHAMSDINVYSVCQLLHSDLYDNMLNGFLHSNDDDEISVLINQCVICKFGNCNRFEIANSLINIL